MRRPELWENCRLIRRTPKLTQVEPKKVLPPLKVNTKASKVVDLSPLIYWSCL